MRLPADLKPSRVVVVRPRGLGDVVLSSAVLDALRRAWPDTRIDYVAEKPSRQLLETDPRLDRIFLLGPPQTDGRITGGGSAAAVKWLREGKPDVVFDLFSNPRTAILTAASGARFRVGLDWSGRRVAYNVRIPRFEGNKYDDNRYSGQVQVDFIRTAGVRWEGDAQPNAPAGPDDHEFARRAVAEVGLDAERPFGAVLPGGSWASKRWTVEAFADTARGLHERTGQPTLVIWGPPEADDAKAIAAAAGEGAVLAPASTLRQMAALTATPRVLVATDCLGRHFGVVQGGATVGVFGTTDPRHWTPRTGPHRTVLAADEGHETLQTLPADPVLREVDALAVLDSPPGEP